MFFLNWSMMEREMGFFFENEGFPKKMVVRDSSFTSHHGFAKLWIHK